MDREYIGPICKLALFGIKVNQSPRILCKQLCTVKLLLFNNWYHETRLDYKPKFYTFVHLDKLVND